jgi:SAM-dependent methyltransferase
MLFLQQITGYVDTKDRETGSGALILNAALSATARTRRSGGSRWRRATRLRGQAVEIRTKAIEATHDELRGLIGICQQAIMVLKREVERRGPAAPASAPAGDGGGAGATDSAAFATALDAYKYVGFEDQFRGSRDVIRARLQSYVPLFEGQTDVLDVGCGRGEFLDLLAGAGIPARGIDLNHEMAEGCRARGLDVAEADAVGYLAGLPDGSLGGIFAAQVVEHLEPAYLLRVLDLSFHKLRPGGRLVLETLNPACWVAFFESYIRDITHRWPLHPETLRYLVTASGFVRADIEFRSPVPEQDRLQATTFSSRDPALAELTDTFNANVAKLNARMFTDMDYAIVATR